MKVLLVKPNEYAVEAEMENSLRAEQKVVEGNIEVFRPGKEPVVYVLNEEGKIMGLDANRALYNESNEIVDIILGTFFVCGIKDGDFISLSPELMEKYKKQFFEPEIFIREKGRIKAIKMGDPEVKKSIAEQMKEGAEQAEKDNAARQSASDRPAPERKPDKDRG